MTKSRSISSVYASVRRCERGDVISFYKVSPQPQPSEEEIVSFQLSLVSKNWLRALIYLWSSEVGLASLVKDVFKQWRDRRRPSRQQLLEKNNFLSMTKKRVQWEKNLKTPSERYFGQSCFEMVDQLCKHH